MSARERKRESAKSPLRSRVEARPGKSWLFEGRGGGLHQIGSCGLNVDQRDALDELGVMYTNKLLSLEVAMVYGRWVRSGKWREALLAARNKARYLKAAA